MLFIINIFLGIICLILIIMPIKKIQFYLRKFFYFLFPEPKNVNKIINE